MILPVRLRRLDAPLPTTGLYVLGRDAGVVVEAIAALGLPLPEVYPLPDGFLLRRGEPIAAHPPGALRLREIAPHLFLPVDAELSPGLLDDEARALVRDRGLVFLPGEVLGYDRTRVPLAELVSVGAVTRGRWRPLPQGSRLPERIRVILDDRPTPAPEVILQQSAGDVGSEEVPPAPDAATTGQAISGRVQAGFGNFFLWLGRMLNWRWLAQRGANLLRGAIQAVPRLAGSVLGRQQAALRELLRQFRQGDPEEALRRALPLTGNIHRGSTVADDASLPTHNLRFDLGDLLATGGSGGSVWLTEADIQMQLAEEYRQAARAAADAGDYRRAAFIYGKLLGDLRLAADMLARGGMWQEAAVLYLERVNDELSAARCFEQAGDIDRAVQLFRKNGAHVEAGDVLSRAGDEEGALAEYQLAADRLAERGRFAEAGDLFRDHVQRPDLAASYYERGWRGRGPGGGATHCVLRLLDLRARTDDRRALLELAREVADYYEENGAESEAVQVFNTLVRLGEQTLPPDEREELRDRSLVGLTRRLRQHAEDQRSGGTVSLLFGRDGVWSPNIVADAEVAFRGAVRTRKPTTGPTPHTIVPLGHGQPTAVAGSLNGEALFVGFDNGDVVRFTPETAAVVPLEQPHRAAIDSMGTDETGSELTLIVGDRLICCRDSLAGSVWPRPQHYRPLNSREVGLQRVSNLSSGIGIRWSPTEFVAFDAIMPEDRLIQAFDPDAPTTGAATVLLVHRHRLLTLRFSYSKVEGFELTISSEWGGFEFPANPSEPATRIDLGGIVPPPSQRLAPIEVRSLPQTNDGMSEFSVLGVDDEGRVWISDLRWIDPLLHRGSFYTRSGGYLAGAMLGPTQAVGVLPDGIAWLRREGHDLVPWTMSKLPLADAVAVWVGWQASEVIVVRRRGDLVRVPRPR